jgi:hypothetical protein
MAQYGADAKGLEITFETELDKAVIEPNVNPLAEARVCACVVADEIKAGNEQVCDCANCCETCVPMMLKKSVSPLLRLAILCCSVVKLAIVLLVFVRGANRLNTHCRLRLVEDMPPL